MTDIKIIVCAKQIPDPEAPLSDVSVDAEKMEDYTKGVFYFIKP